MEKAYWVFCQGNQRDANLWIDYQKCVISAALNIFVIRLRKLNGNDSSSKVIVFSLPPKH